MTTIEDVRQLEAELERKRKTIAADIAAERKKRSLSLRHVAQRVRLTASSLLEIERGDSWRTDTVARVVKFYEREAV